MEESSLSRKLVAFLASLNDEESLQLEDFLRSGDAWLALRHVQQEVDRARSLIAGRTSGPVRRPSRRTRPSKEAPYDQLVAKVIDMVDRMSPSNQKFSEVAQQYFGISMQRVPKKSRGDLKGDLAIALLHADRGELRDLIRRLGSAETVPVEPSELERWFDLITGGREA